MQNETIQTIASASEKVSYVGAGTAIIGGMTATEIAAFGGLIVAIVGVIISNSITWFYSRRSDKYKRKEHELRVSLMMQGKFLDESDEE